MNRVIKIQSFFGIGDLLFATPSLRVIKEAYPDCRIDVNTCHPGIIAKNPFVDRIGPYHIGTVLAYPDPLHRTHPKQHNILSDWDILCLDYRLRTERPALKPEIYIPLPERSGQIYVQTIHSPNFNSKRVWPYFQEFVDRYDYYPIPVQSSLGDLVRLVASARAVVCADSAIQHIARAVGTPAVVVYGGFSDPSWNGYEQHVNLVNRKTCSPCYSKLPCEHPVNRACLREISVTQVRDALEGLLNRSNVCG